jgi:adenine-specific DNA glycosylase
MREVIWPLAIVRSRGKLLLHRRASGGLLAGLWELPGGEDKTGSALNSLLEQYLPDLYGRAVKERRLGEINHSITNRRIRAPVFLLDCAPAPEVRLDQTQWRWIAPNALGRQPTSAMTRKAIKLLTDHEERLL